MNKVIIRIVGNVVEKLNIIRQKYLVNRIIDTFASFGRDSVLNYPCLIQGTNVQTPGVKYIHIGEGVSIGAGSTIFATRAHLYIGDHSFSGPNLTIMTGDHPADIMGSYMADNRKIDLERKELPISQYDSDVVIEEDVWIGCNVTILKGVRIGRGSIVAVGSVVTKSLPAYSISGGNPAKCLKYRWSVDEILEHEKILYQKERRFTTEELKGIKI